MAQQQEEEREANSGSQREQIAVDVLRPQFAHKEQRHADETGRDSYEIAAAKLLSVEQRLEHQDINRCGVLQKNGVGRSGQFGRQDKEDQQRGVKDGSDGADAIYAKAFTAREDRDGNGAQQRSPEGKLKRGKVSGLDEQASGAPENRGADHEQKRRVAGVFLHFNLNSGR